MSHHQPDGSDLTVLGEYTEFNASMVRDILGTNGIEARTIGSSQGQPYQFATVKVVVRQTDYEQALEVIRLYEIGQKVDSEQITAATARGKLWITLVFIVVVTIISCVATYLSLCN